MGKQRRRIGASRHVRRTTIEVAAGSTSATSSRIRTEKINQARINQEKEESVKQLRDRLSGLGGQTLQRVSELQADSIAFQDTSPDVPMDQAMDLDSDIHEPSYNDLNMAREAAGADALEDEDESMLHALRDFVSHPMRRSPQDKRSWRQRLERVEKNWESVMDDLVAAFLQWKYPPRRDSAGDSTRTPDGLEDNQAPSSVPAANTRDTTYDFTIDVIDVYSKVPSKHIARTANQITPVAVALSGYLVTTPVTPTLAVSFNTLEFLRRLRMRRFSYSVEAFAKVVCDLYAIPYHRRFRNALSDAFDVYLKILRAIDKQVNKYLGRDAPNWRVLNSCPPCRFKLDGEDPLTFEQLLCMDGNMSLKRVAQIGDRNVADNREFTDSDYYLLANFVDQFKDEVRRQTGNQDKSSDHEDDAWSDIDSDNEGEDGEGNGGNAHKQDKDGPAAKFAGADDVLRNCTRNWKAAAEDEKKRTWGIFEESGIFAAACRHGLILWVIDMVRSGELAKYPLAIVAKAMQELGERLLIGYDVGCSFSGTIDRSSLGPEFARLKCRCCVNAFHGYSHSHKCQTVNHPTVIKGAGLEDFEGMERLFSSSNALAIVIRYASKFHRRVLIDLFCRQWDEEKYANLATMLFNNYRQALEIISEVSVEVAAGLALLKCSESDLERWEKEEAAYFAELGKESEEDVFAMTYVSLLRELWALQNKSAASMSAFVMSIPEDYEPSGSSGRSAYNKDISRTCRLEADRRYQRELLSRVTRDVIDLETRMGITERWHPHHPKYIEFSAYMDERDYRLALDNLQRLVVQRLFELHTMNLSQTAYKVRTHIAKSLQRRSKAIHAAVKAYNVAAAKLKPPRPPLEWTKVTHYSFLEEFVLLRDTRNDIRGKPWANTATRQLMKKARSVRCARDEIYRCNIEIRRLHTFILEEDKTLENAVHTAREDGLPIAGPIADLAIRRQRVNARQLSVIEKIYALPGFTGNPTPGKRAGCTGSNRVEDGVLPNADTLSVQEEVSRADDHDSKDAMYDEEEMSEANRLLDFATSLA